MASANNHEEAVRFLLERGADINRQNKNMNTALHWAALTGHLSIVKLLCETQKQDCNLKNHAGLIAFEYALQAQKTEIAEYLAPLSKLEDDKVYSEIPEAQFWPSHKDESEDNRSQVSEEAIRNEDEKQEDPEVVR